MPRSVPSAAPTRAVALAGLIHLPGRSVSPLRM